MGHIFISYSRRDSKVVDNIIERLAKDGFKVWVDREEIKGGELWREAIVEAVDTAHVCILMLSPDSVASDNVRKEVDLAEGAGKALVPVLLAPVNLPANFRYQLAGIQQIEYFLDPNEKYNELVQVLRPHQQESKPIGKDNEREVEIVIEKIKYSNFGSEQQEKLLEFLADLTNTPRREINIVRMAPGSVHAFINLPINVAYQLKTSALNQNARLIGFNISAIRFSGDRYFVLLKTGKIGPLNAGGKWLQTWVFGSLSLFALVLFIFVIKNKVGSITITPTFTNTPASTMTLTRTPTNTPAAGNTNTGTILKDTLCLKGPGLQYEPVSSLLKDDQVEILGIGNVEDWFIIENPIYHNPCWLDTTTLEVDPNLDISTLKVFSAPNPPTHTPTNTPAIPVSPIGPTGLGINSRICAGSTYNVILGWNDNANNETGFHVYRRDDGVNGSFQLINSLTANTKSYSDSPPYGGPYSYYVEAFNTIGTSPSSNIVTDQGCLP